MAILTALGGAGVGFKGSSAGSLPGAKCRPPPDAATVRRTRPGGGAPSSRRRPDSAAARCFLAAACGGEPSVHVTAAADDSASSPGPASLLVDEVDRPGPAPCEGWSASALCIAARLTVHEPRGPHFSRDEIAARCRRRAGVPTRAGAIPSRSRSSPPARLPNCLAGDYHLAATRPGRHTLRCFAVIRHAARTASGCRDRIPTAALWRAARRVGARRSSRRLDRRIGWRAGAGTTPGLMAVVAARAGGQSIPRSARLRTEGGGARVVGPRLDEGASIGYARRRPSTCHRDVRRRRRDPSRRR